MCCIKTATLLAEVGNSLSAEFYLEWCDDILPELVGGKKSSAADSHVVNQDLVLFWESEPFIRLTKKSECAFREDVLIFLCQHQHVRSNRESGRPVGQSGLGHSGGYISSTIEQKLWYLGGFSNVILVQWECKEWFAIRREIEKAAAVQTWQVCSRRGASIQRFVGRDVKVKWSSPCYQTLSGLLILSSSRLQMLI